MGLQSKLPDLNIVENVGPLHGAGRDLRVKFELELHSKVKIQGH